MLIVAFVHRQQSRMDLKTLRISSRFAELVSFTNAAEQLGLQMARGRGLSRRQAPGRKAVKKRQRSVDGVDGVARRPYHAEADPVIGGACLRNMCCTRLVLLIVASLAVQAASGAPTAAWTLGYHDRSTNEFIWDKRTRSLVASTTHAGFANVVLDNLGGPPDPVVVHDGRYFSASACVPHFCPDKGFFWLDTATGAALGAIFNQETYPGKGGQLHLDSTRIRGGLPDSVRRSIVDWLDESKVVPTAVDFVDATGVRRSLSPDDFTAPLRFVPPDGGPSFDCANAGSRIERTICGDPELAAQDLALAVRYREVGLGGSTLAYRRQLAQFHQQWLRRRDRVCGEIADIVPCLKDQYRAQSTAIWNWVPPRSPSPAAAGR